MPAPIVALCGNPNTGKSTIFNSLTGGKRHTGNWSGKTVDNAAGVFDGFSIADLPGMYSLSPRSDDEERAVNFLKANEAYLTVITADGTCLERNLILALQIADISKRALLCINMMDEAEKKGIKIDAEGLSRAMGIRVILISAGRDRSLALLKQAIKEGAAERPTRPLRPIEEYSQMASRLFKEFVSVAANKKLPLERRIDNLVLNTRTGILIIGAVFAFLIWLTVIGANYPSAVLSYLFSLGRKALEGALSYLNIAPPLKSLLTEGVYAITSEVISVMLPPMAIFFPLFAFLEDLGFLPRIAFVMDRFFKSCGTNGKQALCMCMGIGCNAAGVMSSRIIESPRQRRAAILTNVFMPCNGRFPFIITLSIMFLSGAGLKSLTAALAVLAALTLGAAVTLPVTGLLMRGEKNSFVLELPPYRIPRLGQILLHSFKDKVCALLIRAVMASIPAGIVIWLMRSITFGGSPLISLLSKLLNPIGRLMGLDGAVLSGFLLGLPANEIVLPLILSIYGGEGSTRAVLLQNGWGLKTALCAIIFCLFHYPCATTLMTVKRETNSLGLTAFAALLPTAIGFMLCCLLNLVIP